MNRANERRWMLPATLVAMLLCPSSTPGQSSTHIDAAAIRAVLSVNDSTRVAIDPRYVGQTLDPIGSLRDTMLQQVLEKEFKAQSLPIETVVCPGVRDARRCRLQNADVFVRTSRPVLAGSQATMFVSVTTDPGRSNAYPEVKVWLVRLQRIGSLWTVVEWKLQSVS